MTTDSVSTMNCVKDRSGAPNSRKMTATAKPWMPSAMIAVRRLEAVSTAMSPATAMAMKVSSWIGASRGHDGMDGNSP